MLKYTDMAFHGQNMQSRMQFMIIHKYCGDVSISFYSNTINTIIRSNIIYRVSQEESAILREGVPYVM
jgi:hypothetical protein